MSSSELSCESLAKIILQFFVVSCILQSIHGSYDYEVSTLKPRRIAGGRDASVGLAPFQCSLQVNRKHYCGCAVINSNFVVTAGHCVNETSPKDVTILVGTNDLNSGGTYYDIERFKIHEQYDKTKNDIALVKINGSIEFNEQVKPIELDEKEVPDGVEAVVTGWGQLRLDGVLPEKLQFLKLNVLQTDLCKNSTIGEQVDDSHICTYGVKGKGACSNDSGGPLVYDKKIIGIVNFGILCEIGYPDVFAKISYFYDWIKKNTST